jgi:hypothetical protein
MTKSEFIQTIRQFIAEGKTEEALDLLRQHISDYDTSMLTDATLLQSRFQNAHTDSVIKGILPREDYDRTTAQVSYAVLELLEKIEKDAVVNTGVPKDKNSGRILHNIPGTMPLAKETRCIIRIAYDDASLTRDFKTTEDTVIQSVRIAEVMGVELLDFNEIPAFQIRTINDEEQFVANDDFTQWLFLVKPLHEGRYPLTLKVAVIEQIDGKERKRDIVLEKEVFIIGQVAVPQSPPTAPTPSSARISNETIAFEDTNMKLNYVVIEDTRAVTTSASSPADKKRTMTGVFSVLATIIIAMTGLYVYNGGFSGKTSNDNVVITKPSDNAAKNNPTTLDTSYFKVNDNIAQLDTIKKTNDMGNPANLPKKDIIAATPTPIKPPKKTPIKPAKSKKTKTNQSELAGNTPNKKREVGPQTNASHSTPQDPFEDRDSDGDGVPDDVDKENENTQTKDIKKIVEKSYKVRIKLKGEMKEAEILVNGEKPIAVKKNIWGTPQYVEFKSTSAKQTFTFIHNGISCKVENIEIINDEVIIEACSFDKR